ncbi:Uu.00g122380.m01.CDS01 [Anthostomella pinea]|uniref:Uu.00g122380.m01.CDS01 n=1 Tax=Anthostomella pinea TaxID=933095 RepID=A0AAI8YHE0_9PEZI|nr:Uu.00g122380.m01.CDS01 [Anthostomella pinea]
MHPINPRQAKHHALAVIRPAPRARTARRPSASVNSVRRKLTQMSPAGVTGMKSPICVLPVPRGVKVDDGNQVDTPQASMRASELDVKRGAVQRGEAQLLEGAVEQGFPPGRLRRLG